MAEHDFSGLDDIDLIRAINEAKQYNEPSDKEFLKAAQEELAKRHRALCAKEE